VSGRIVQTGVQAKVDVHGSSVVGRVQRGASERVRHVVAVERGLGRLVDRDTVGLDLQSIDGLSNARERNRASSNHRRNVLMVQIGSVKGDGLIGHNLTLRRRRAIQLLVGEQRQAMPVTVLVGVGRRDVLHGAQTDVHGFNGPLKLRQQLVISRRVHSRGLKAMNADQREST
tara:strand:+ start:54573 stop:55091 length:519 start_codon:yes stop_codon:yes gene_type:complete